LNFSIYKIKKYSFFFEMTLWHKEKNEITLIL